MLSLLAATCAQIHTDHAAGSTLGPKDFRIVVVKLLTHGIPKLDTRGDAYHGILGRDLELLAEDLLGHSLKGGRWQ